MHGIQINNVTFLKAFKIETNNFLWEKKVTEQPPSRQIIFCFIWIYSRLIFSQSLNCVVVSNFKQNETKFCSFEYLTLQISLKSLQITVIFKVIYLQ